MPPRFAFGLFDSEVQVSVEFTVLPQLPWCLGQHNKQICLKETIAISGVYKEVNAYGI